MCSIVSDCFNALFVAEHNAHLVGRMRSPEYRTLIISIVVAFIVTTPILCFRYGFDTTPSLIRYFLLLVLAGYLGLLYKRDCSPNCLLRLTRFLQVVIFVASTGRCNSVLLTMLDCPGSMMLIDGNVLPDDYPCPTNISRNELLLASVATGTATTVGMPAFMIAFMIPFKVVVPLTTVYCVAAIYAASRHLTMLDTSIAFTLPVLQGVTLMLFAYAASTAMYRIAREQDVHDQEKRKWLASVGHNVGTPLTSIVLATDAIAAINKDETVAKYLQHVDVAIDYIRVVYTTLMSGMRNAPCRDERLNVQLLLTHCRNMLEAYALNWPNVKTTYEIDGNVPPFIIADRGKLQQCVVNVGSNAYKYTMNGTIAIRLMCCSGCLRIQFVDSGRGIPKEKLTHLFNVGGAGLGLTSVARMMDSMGGTYTASNNAPAPGATFCLDIPLKADIELDIISANIHDDHTSRAHTNQPTTSDEDGENKTTHTTQKPYDILLVDDQSFNRAIIVNSLQTDTICVSEANNGKVALEMMAQHDFDLILMDIEMPVMNGEECMVEIESRFGNKRPPVWALTCSTIVQNHDGNLFDAWYDKSIPVTFTKAINKYFTSQNK